MLWSDFQKPKKLDYDPETLTANYGRFIAQPFERGFGTTIGNALRRVLLSSIEGAAITAIRVEGVLHEFSSLTGIVEDMTDVVLNLKQVPFRLHGEGPKTLYLEKKGPGVVTAADFDQDSDIEILDPRPFFGDWISGGGSIGRRAPTEEEDRDIERGLEVARRLAAVGVGQTVVVRLGLCLAVEASEGTTETVRRGLALAGPGAVVVKAVFPEHDYRFDVPLVGPETLHAMEAGRAGALAIEAGRVLILERDRVIEIADRAKIAIVSVPPGTGHGTRG